MSTNHNRIKVADLETNEPNKILKTNAKGELEFSNVIDNKQFDLASDSETQINYTVAEDEKVISRLKLFNWWEWLKTKNQTVFGDWIFKSSLIFGNSGYFTSDSFRFYMRAFTGKKLEIGVEGTPVDAISIDLNGILLRNRLTLIPGDTAIPSLIFPNGKLTTIPQDGAIERDENGQLWETHGGIRSQLSSAGKSQNYKVYTAILNQTGTNAPIATILENTMSSDIIFEYTSKGTYSGTLTNAFPEGKTFFITTAPNTPGSGNIFYIGRVDNNTITLSFRKSMTAFDEIVNAMMEIRVYQ
ncbi:hypothetical protein [Flavobacterium sp. ASV13]|uniref:hypothetical protein n=1 Tax=Flavobacterium sp. ASV13 TaxID=1506583 RepID=UPI00054EF77B|nr:hypothetical protein [Flavobacterium sp. ASV13]